MSEEKQPLGKVAFDAAYDQWADGLIGSPTVQWAELDDPAQTGWGIIAGAVAAEVANPTAEDYDHAAEEIARRSEPAKVIVVITEHTGRERRFNADNFTHGLFGLTVQRDAKTIAYYPNGTYLSVREDGAEVPDATKRALTAAIKGLKQIDALVDDTENREWADLRIMAGDILDEIFTETE